MNETRLTLREGIERELKEEERKSLISEAKSDIRQCLISINTKKRALKTLEKNVDEYYVSLEQNLKELDS